MAKSAMERHEFWCSCGGCVEVWCVGSVVILPGCPRCGRAMREVTFLQFAWQWNEKGRRRLAQERIQFRNKKAAQRKKPANRGSL